MDASDPRRLFEGKKRALSSGSLTRIDKRIQIQPVKWEADLEAPCGYRSVFLSSLMILNMIITLAINR